MRDGRRRGRGKSAESLRIGVNESAARAVRLLLAPELGRLAVIENDRLVGIVTRHDILHFIEIHGTGTVRSGGAATSSTSPSASSGRLRRNINIQHPMDSNA